MDNQAEHTDDGRDAVERDFDNTLDRDVDLDELRNGGPTRTPGIMTTTGGTAGPASVAAALRAHAGGSVGSAEAGQTTTGDAGSSGMGTEVGGGYSDATTTGQSGGTAVGGSDTDADQR